MEAKEAIAYLEEIKKYGSVPGLDSIRGLLEYLDNPQDQLRVIHVAGTNGKGSILAMLESVLRMSGYKTGRYHSPVLFDTKEAFQVNQQWILEEDLCRCVETVKKAADRMVEEGKPHPTSFEVETAIAFVYFLEQKVDVVLLETGMGGRLDATNIIKHPLVDIVASVSMDHMQFLGNTIEEIAKEKAGIIKENTDVVLYPSEEKIYRVVEDTCNKQHAHLTMADAGSVRFIKQDMHGQSFSYRTRDGHYYEKITIPLLGEHQIYNAITAIEVLEHLKKHFCMGIFQIEQGFSNVAWPGRLEVIGKRPYILRDGAHNEDAAKQLAKFMENNFTNKRIFYIMGVLRDKEYEKILRIMAPYAEDLYTVTPNNARGLDAEELADHAGKYYQNVHVAGSVQKAVEEVLAQADEDDVILLFGSLSFMKEIEELRNYGTIPKGRRS